MHFAHFHPCPLPLQVILAISGATTRNDLSSVLSALELATQLHTTDGAGMRDTVVRHVGSLPVWKDFRWGEGVMGGDARGDGGSMRGGGERSCTTKSMDLVAPAPLCLCGLRFADLVFLPMSLASHLFPLPPLLY